VSLFFARLLGLHNDRGIRRRAAWIAGLAMLAPMQAHALGLACSASTTGVAFGNYDPSTALPTKTVGNVRVACSVALVSVLTQINIRLSTGISGSYTPRKLASGVNTLDYNLYTDLLNTSVWGDGTGGTGIVTHNVLIAVLGTVIDSPVYGTIAAGQYVPVGSYSDSITVTVEYHEVL